MDNYLQRLIYLHDSVESVIDDLSLLRASIESYHLPDDPKVLRLTNALGRMANLINQMLADPPPYFDNTPYGGATECKAPPEFYSKPRLTLVRKPKNETE